MKGREEEEEKELETYTDLVKLKNTLKNSGKLGQKSQNKIQSWQQITTDAPDRRLCAMKFTKFLAGILALCYQSNSDLIVYCVC